MLEPANLSQAGDAYAPLSGSAEWYAANKRPVLIVGNGPSCGEFDPDLLPDDAVIVRINTFFLETDYTFGRRVDGIFWSVPRRWMQIAYNLLAEQQIYDIGTYFNPHSVKKPALPMFADEASEIDARLHPRESHNDVLSQIPGLGSYVGVGRAQKGLPTQGMLAIATMLAYGFTEIYTIGIDFYQGVNSRYHFEYPEFLRAINAPVHLTPGYESVYHSIELDLRFLATALEACPNANLYSLSPSSYFSKFALRPLKAASPFSTSKAVAKSSEYLDRLKDRCLWFAAGAGQVIGALTLVRRQTLLLWAWDYAEPDVRRIVDVFVDGVRVKSYVLNKYYYELDIGGIGDGSAGVLIGPAELDTLGDKPLHFVDRLSGKELLGSPYQRFSQAAFNGGVAEIWLVGLGAVPGAHAPAGSPAVRLLPGGEIHWSRDPDADEPDPAPFPSAETLRANAQRLFGSNDDIALELAFVLACLEREAPERPIALEDFAAFGAGGQDVLAEMISRRSEHLSPLLKAMQDQRIYSQSPEMQKHMNQALRMLLPCIYLYDDSAIASDARDIAAEALSQTNQSPASVRPIGASTWNAGGRYFLTGPAKKIIVVDGAVVAKADRSLEAALQSIAETSSLTVILDHVPARNRAAVLSSVRRLAQKGSKVSSASLSISRDLSGAAVEFRRSKAMALREALSGAVEDISIGSDQALRIGVLADLTLPRWAARAARLASETFRALSQGRPLQIDIVSSDASVGAPFEVRLGPQTRVVYGLEAALKATDYDLLIVDNEDTGLSAVDLMILGRDVPIVCTGSSGLAEFAPPATIFKDCLEAFDTLLRSQRISALRQPDLMASPVEREAVSHDEPQVQGRQAGPVMRWETSRPEITSLPRRVIQADPAAAFPLVEARDNGALQVHPFGPNATMVRLEGVQKHHAKFLLMVACILGHEQAMPIEIAAMCVPSEAPVPPEAEWGAGHSSRFSGWRRLNAMQTELIEIELALEKPVDMDLVVMSRPVDPLGDQSYMWALFQDLVVISDLRSR